jgi:hypothetical protein
MTQNNAQPINCRNCGRPVHEGYSGNVKLWFHENGSNQCADEPPHQTQAAPPDRTADYGERLRSNPDFLIKRLLSAACQFKNSGTAEECRDCIYCTERRVAAAALRSVEEALDQITFCPNSGECLWRYGNGGPRRIYEILTGKKTR